MIARSLAPLPSIPTPLSLPLYLVAAQLTAPGFWPRSVRVASFLKTPKRCSTSVELHAYSKAAAKPPLSIAATRGRSLFTRALSSTPTNLSGTASGPAPSTRCTRPPKKATGSSSAHWLTNGSVSSSAAGRSIRLMTNFVTSSHCKKAAPHCCHTLPSQPPNSREKLHLKLLTDYLRCLVR